MSLLSLISVRAGYGGGTVLHGIDLQVPAGKVTVVVGANGAGKTTLLHTIAGLHPVAGGRILHDRTDITAWPAHRVARTGIALVPQGRRLFDSLTVRDHLRFPRSAARTVRAPTWTTEQILGMFPQLRDRLGHRARVLSGGEQQMLAIARALLTQPSMLLLDEPTEGLAPTVTGQVCDTISLLAAQGVAVLAAAPTTQLAARIADEVHVLTAGRFTATVTGENARTDPAVLAAHLLPAAATPLPLAHGDH